MGYVPRPLVALLAAVVALSAISFTHAAAQPEPGHGWHWEQALTLPERVRLESDSAPILGADGTRLVAAPAPWNDDGVLRAEALVYTMRDGRLTATSRLDAAVPDAPTGTPSGGRISVAAGGGHAALGLAGHRAGSGVVHVVGSGDQRLDAPAEAVGFGRSVALSHDLLAVGSVDAVYVYGLGEEGWMPYQTLEGVAGGGFGTALALGEGVLAVGAPASGPDGVVEVFHLTAKGLARVATVASPAGGSGFGSTLALHEGTVYAMESVHGRKQVHRLGPDADAWTATATWDAGATVASLDVHADMIVVASPEGIRSFALEGGASRHDRVTDQLVIGPRFGQDVSFLGEALIVADPADRIHVFQQGASCGACLPMCDPCEEAPAVAEEAAGAVSLVPGSPWTDSPHPDVSITYDVQAPALLVHDIAFSQRTPEGLPAVPGNEEAPEMTNYVVVHVERFEATGNASPEPRIRIEMAARAPQDIDPGRVAIFFFDGRQWTDLARVPPGTSVPATTAEGDLLVYGAGREPDGAVWAVVDHTSAYAVGLRPLAAFPASAPPLMEGPWTLVGVLTFIVGGVWATNAIVGAGLDKGGPSRRERLAAGPVAPRSTQTWKRS